jgi:hypothetical protein
LYCGSYVAGSTMNRSNRYNNYFYNSLGLSANLNGGDKVYYLYLSEEKIVSLYLSNAHKNLAMLLFKGRYVYQNGHIEERFDELVSYSSSTSTTNEQLVGQHLTPGYYMLIIDSAPYGESSFNLSVYCSPVNTSCSSTPGTSLFYDNFEYRNLGSISVQSDYWNKWNSNKFDGEVQAGKWLAVDYKENQAYNDQPDFILDLGSRYYGNYQLNFDMWIYSNNSAYFNVQKTIRSEYGAYFVFNQNGQGYVYVNGRVINFTFPNAKWMKVRLDVNLDTNITTLYIDGIYKASWYCTDTAYGSGGSRVFRGLNFQTLSNSLYFIDNVCYIKRF